MKYTKTDVINELHRVADKLGHSPSMREFDQESQAMGEYTVRQRFGGWNEAKRAAGLNIIEQKSGPEPGTKRGLYRKIKKEVSCLFCDEERAPAVHLHHANPEMKKFNVSDYDRENITLQDLVDEIEKCVPICANCHACIHFGELDLDTDSDTIDPPSQYLPSS